MDAEEMTSVIRDVASDESLRREMIAQGRARAQDYSLRATARETLRVYERAMG